MTNSRFRKVPSGRISRAAVFGQLAGSVAGGVLAEGARRLARGERPHMSDLLLTPASIGRVTEQLSRLRGAAMKLGQMISMDAGDILPPELTAILARLRNSAHFMPAAQLDKVLRTEWGADWRKRFRRFEATPVAAASIGQVHRATLPDGRLIAVKVQYPGIAASIDADVDNVATLLRMTGLLPASLDIAPLLAEAKRQLHEEADYHREAAQLRRYAAMLAANEPRFVVPGLIDELCTQLVLAMDFVSGQPIEVLLEAPQASRDAAMEALFRLVLREMFEFGFMQTDPNFANYRWQADAERIVLLDFGASRQVIPETAQAYRQLMVAGLAGDHAGLRAAMVAAGFVSPFMLDRHAAAFDGMIAVLMEHLGRPGLFDFADRSFVERLRRYLEPVVADRLAWHIPPMDVLFVQRKISGTALLAVNMKARFDLRALVASVLSATGEPTP